jgi:hypothetical protein
MRKNEQLVIQAQLRNNNDHDGTYRQHQGSFGATFRFVNNNIDRSTAVHNAAATAATPQH